MSAGLGVLPHMKTWVLYGHEPRRLIFKSKQGLIMQHDAAMMLCLSTLNNIRGSGQIYGCEGKVLIKPELHKKSHPDVYGAPKLTKCS